MAKKKKKNLNGGDANEEEKAEIENETGKSAAAVFLFALAIIFLLGFFDVAGSLGKFLNKIAEVVFGWGKWTLPLVLVAGGIFLLYRQETFFYISKIFGLAAAFLSVLGFLHIYLDREKLLELAKAGAGGGHIGFAVSWLLLKIAGIYAGTVILAAVFFIGLILAFNFSVASFFRKLISLRLSKKEISEESEIKENNLPEEKKIADEKETRFVEDPEEDRVWIEENIKADIPKFSVKPLTKEPSLKKREKSVTRTKKWKFPPVELLASSTEEPHGGDVNRNAKIITDTFRHFGIEVDLGGILVGPTVTQYSFRPAVGVKLSRMTTLNNDLALALAAHPIRIEAPIPGKSLVGIEVPNKTPTLVRMRNLLESKSFQNKKSNLTLALGKDVSGNYILEDLKKMPHLMIAGSTGTGKSVCVNSILLSLLYQNSPEDLQLVLIDPKRVELSPYNGIPHLLADTIVENGKALNAFKWAIGEMERRYRLFQDTNSRDLESYNQKVTSGEKRRYTDPETGETIEEEVSHLPYVVIVIDELADLMSSHGKEVEGAIIRLAQMARAVGIHLIVSTQRPSVEVLTGLIKANITTRIAFKVATQIDSRTILDTGGAEKLLGNGDMLLLSSQTGKLKRVQGVLISETEVNQVVKFLLEQKDNRKEEEITREKNNLFSETKIDFVNVRSNAENDDPLYESAKVEIIENQKASVSFLQRRLKLGYARAARLMDMLERNGVVSQGEGAKPRKILIARPSVPEGSFSSQKQSNDNIYAKQSVAGEKNAEYDAENDEKDDFETEENSEEESASADLRDKWQI